MTHSHSAEKSKPNIVFIISDDQAWTDYGFMGHPEIKTPNLDRLADQSLLFERGYVAASLSSFIGVNIDRAIPISTRNYGERC